MPSLKLVPKNASLHLQVGDFNAAYQVIVHKKKNDELVFEPTFNETLSYEVVLESILSRYRLTSGEEFSELKGTISLKRSAIENTDEPIGHLSYFPKFESIGALPGSDAAYALNCELPARQFDELISAARQGRMPSAIWALVVGDGVTMSETVDLDWNNTEHPHVAVSQISFYLRYVWLADHDKYDEDNEVLAKATAASQDQLIQLLRKIDEVGKSVKILVYVAIIATIILAVGRNWFN